MRIKNTCALVLFIIGCSISQSAHGQLLKKMKERAKQAAEETVLRKTEEITTQETSKKIDTIYDKASRPQKKKKRDKNPNDAENETIDSSDGTGTPSYHHFGIYSKFTFVPGNKQLFNDNFGMDGIGDFPASWETAGSGEVVTVDGYETSWLSLQRRSGYYPSIEKELPENYTIEFDLISNGYGTGSGSSKLYLAFLPKKAYSMGQAGSVADIELLFSDSFSVRNVENFGNEAQMRVVNTIDRNRADLLNAPMHISIAVNKKRLRLWINEEKYVDSPNILQGKLGRHFIIEARNILPEKGHFVGISNFVIAEAEEDLRSLLLKNGKFATTGIYFEPDSWIVKKESYGIIKEISEVLKAVPDLQLNIVGHTDSDGPEEYNLSLSKNRAEAVKQILVEEFGIEEGRLQYEGKGEADPVADNNTAVGKANNRRVEFIKN